jgi:hypothetical protein
MKQCSYCGKELPDEATVCPLDGEPVANMNAEGRRFDTPHGNLAIGAISSGNSTNSRITAILKTAHDEYKAAWRKRKLKILTNTSIAIVVCSIIFYITLAFGNTESYDPSNQLQKQLGLVAIVTLMITGAILMIAIPGIAIELIQCLRGPPLGGRNVSEAINKFYSAVFYGYGRDMDWEIVNGMAYVQEKALIDIGNVDGFRQHWAAVRRMVKNKLGSKTFVSNQGDCRFKLGKVEQLSESVDKCKVRIVIEFYGLDYTPNPVSGRGTEKKIYGPITYTEEHELICENERWHLSSGEWRGKQNEPA